MSTFPVVAVIGAGLIGSSILRAVQERQARGDPVRLVAMDSDPAHRLYLSGNGLADLVCDDAARAVAGADLVILATPPGAFPDIVRRIAAVLGSGAVLSDVGSIKETVTTSLGAILAESGRAGDVFLVPAHPVAGTEKSGPQAGFGSLFRERWCIITPPPGTPPEVTARLSAFWQGLGAITGIMAPGRHDLVLALTSHLPHLVAWALVGTARTAGDIGTGEVMRFSAGGFRDFTRIASSDPALWRDIFLMNRENLLGHLARFRAEIDALAELVGRGDGPGLEARLERARQTRQEVTASRTDTGQETTASQKAPGSPGG